MELAIQDTLGQNCQQCHKKMNVRDINKTTHEMVGLYLANASGNIKKKIARKTIGDNVKREGLKNAREETVQLALMGRNLTL